jgi:hypothetical protein
MALLLMMRIPEKVVCQVGGASAEIHKAQIGHPVVSISA